MRDEILSGISDFLNLPSEMELQARVDRLPKKFIFSRRNFLETTATFGVSAILLRFGVRPAKAEMSQQTTENLIEKEAKEKLKKIFDIETRLENAGWQENKKNVDLVRRYVKERPNENTYALQWLRDASADAKLKPENYLDFGKDKGVKKETTITALSKSVTLEDTETAKKFVDSFGFLGMKIFVFDKTDQALKLPFKMGESANTAYRIGDTIYIAKTSLDKLPHEAFHIFDDVAHKYLSPEQFAELEKYKAQLLAGKHGRMYPDNLATLLEWSFLPGKWGEDKSFARAANFYPAQIFYHGGDLSMPRSEILENSALKINWGNLDLRLSKNLPNFLIKLIGGYKDFLALNTSNLFGEVFKEMISGLPFKNIEEGFVFGLGDDDPKNFKEIFRRLGDRVVASWLWRGDKEDVLKKFMSPEDIKMAKEKLATLISLADDELIAEAVKLVHLSKVSGKTDVTIPFEASLIYNHIFESVNGK